MGRAMILVCPTSQTVVFFIPDFGLGSLPVLDWVSGLLGLYRVKFVLGFKLEREWKQIYRWTFSRF